MTESTDIAKRLEELNKWQEEQKKLLNQRQNMQRQMLGLEQRNMYQILGLLENECDEHVEEGGGGDHLELAKDSSEQWEKCNLTEGDAEADIGSRNVSNFDLIERACDELEREVVFSRTVVEKQVLEERASISARGVRTSCYSTSHNDAGRTELVEKPQKRTFLRRGEGLKQRFNIDPEVLRINNLPPYKYSSSHPSLTSLRSKTSAQSLRSTQSQEIDSNAKEEPIDAQEKRFQQLLVSSQNTCSSTPEVKAAPYSSQENRNAPQKKVSFTECAPLGNCGSKTVIDTDVQMNTELSEESMTSSLPPITWSKVLDSQQIKPMQLQQIRASNRCADDAADMTDEQLSIFELLEQRAKEGDVELNASSIRQFMQRKISTKIGDEGDIPVDDRLLQSGLQPNINELEAANTTTSDDEEQYTRKDLHEEHTPMNDMSDTNDLSSKNSKALMHVRFSVGDITQGTQPDDTVSASSTVVDEESQLVEADSTLNSENMFQQFKKALFTALQSRAEKVMNTSVEGDSTYRNTDKFLAPPSSGGSSVGELQEKTNLIKTRLDELEKEIATFKENNKKLIQAKQDHELEKALYTQEHLAAMGRLKDEKLQLEIYLHDERMKIEEEKHKFEVKMRSLKSSIAQKERKESAQLKQDLEDLQMQMRAKEHTQLTSQRRLQNKIRVLEKDQKQLLDDIEALRKENKRLENEIVRITREKNNKMLNEINKNIAKLAPKLNGMNAQTASVSPSPPARPKARFVVPTISPPIKAPTTKRHVDNIKAISTPSRNVNVNCKSKKVLPQTITSYNSSSDEDEGREAKSKREVLKQNSLASCRAEIVQPTERISRSSSPNTQSDNEMFEEKRQHDDVPPPTPRDFKREIINADNSKDIWYPNGNLKKISADGMQLKMLYFNKDIKETNINEGTVRYYYAASNIWHTTYVDGLEILEFPNGQTEHRYKSGLVEVHFPNNSVKITDPSDETKLEEWRFPDGTNLVQMRNGDRILNFANGQKEVHTAQNKRREYPDGTVKLVYPDGSQETRYSNGRVRLKDKHGKLILDKDAQKM